MDRKVALVTGAGRGIGKAIARELALDGYNIVINYNTSEDGAKELYNSFKELNITAMLVKCDITNEQEVKNMVDAVIKKFGHIDVLVNNAGIAIDALFNEKTVEEFKKTLNVNVIGTFLVSK